MPDSARSNGASTIRLIQALRAAACVMVVIYHAMQAVSPDHGWANGAAGVDLFFVISGFVMLRSSRGLTGVPGGWGVFLARRICRLVPLYWSLTGVKLLFTLARPALTPLTHPTAASLLENLLFVPARNGAGIVRPLLAVGWTLNFEFLFYALFALCLGLRLHPLWMSPLLLCLTVTGFWREDSWPAPFYLANGLVLEFVAGMVLVATPLRLSPKTALCLAAAACAALFFLPSMGPWRCIAWGVPATGIVAAAIALEPKLGPRVPALLVAAGDASYAIYLIHPFVVPAMVRCGPVCAGLSVPASVVAGLAVHWFIDAPLQRVVKEGSSSFLKKRTKKLLTVA